MGEHEVIVNDIHDIFININKGTITEDSINNVCDTHKQILDEMDQAYRCMRSLYVTNNFIIQTNNYLKILC